MEVHEVAVERLAAMAAPYNPRKIKDHDLKALGRSLRLFGVVEPVIVNTRSGHVVGGHQRVKAAQAEGMDTLPVVEVDLDEPSERQLNVALNRISGQWDEDKLAVVIGEIDAAGGDLSLTGLEPFEVDKYLNSLAGADGTKAEPVPDPPANPVTQLGDLWVMGEHRLLCGDATSPGSWTALVRGGEPRAVVTDPPYGIGFDYSTHDDSRDAWFGLMDAVIPQMRAVAPFVVMPCCGIDRMGWWYANHAPDWLMAWYKGSPGHRSHVGFNDWEAMLVWGKPPRQMHDYFQTECGFRSTSGHPCPKPVAWAAWLCQRAASRGDIIVDPFVGSGTTLIAADQIGRRCYALEIDPAYCDVVVERWETLTGGKATRRKAP